MFLLNEGFKRLEMDLNALLDSVLTPYPLFVKLRRLSYAKYHSNILKISTKKH